MQLVHFEEWGANQCKVLAQLCSIPSLHALPPSGCCENFGSQRSLCVKRRRVVSSERNDPLKELVDLWQSIYGALYNHITMPGSVPAIPFASTIVLVVSGKWRSGRMQLWGA